MNKIKCVIKNPGKKAYFAEIDNTLNCLQKTVDGPIETVSIAPDLVIICNEEGLLRDYKFNCTVTGIQFFGTIIFVGKKEDDFADMPIGEDDFKFAFSDLFKRGRY